MCSCKTKYERKDRLTTFNLNLVRNEDIASNFVDPDAINDDLVIPSNYRTQNYSLSWASKLVSFSSDLQALSEVFNRGPHFYKEVFTHCDNDLKYNILFKTSDNKLVSLSEINNAID